MNDLRDLAEFEAARFAPALPEDSQVNPGVYGAELAFWLSAELAANGVATGYPGAEDWGWYIEFRSASGADFAIHCGNVDGARDQWFLQLRRFGRKLFGRDKPSFDEAAPLIEALEVLLRSSPEVSRLEWRYSSSSDVE